MTAPSRPRFPLALERLQGAARPAPADLLRPQRPLHQAVREAARRIAPGGVGLDSDAVRARLVERLRAGGIGDAALLEAFQRVPRHRFVDSAFAAQAYEDTSLPIGHDQTISKPSVVARMLALLRDGASARRAGGHLGRVLEIGSGCGYQAALLSLLADRVVSIERLRPLHEKARAHLGGWRGGEIRLLHGDGTLGHAAAAPYDSIVAAAGGGELPPAWLEQLADGGRLVAPVYDGSSRSQVLVVVDRVGGRVVRRTEEPVRFVPLRRGTA